MMFIRTLQIQFNIPGAGSLKDKRQVLQSLIVKIRQKFNVSIIESDFHGQWNRSELGLAILGNQNQQVERFEQTIVDFIEEFYPAEITQVIVNDY